MQTKVKTLLHADLTSDATALFHFKFFDLENIKCSSYMIVSYYGFGEYLEFVKYTNQGILISFQYGQNEMGIYLY